MECELKKWLGGRDVINQLSALICTALLADIGRTDGKPAYEVCEEMLTSQPQQGRLEKYMCNPDKLDLPRGCILDTLLHLQKQSELDEWEAQILRDRLLSQVNTTIEDLHQVLLWQTNTLFTHGGTATVPTASVSDDVSVASSVSDYKPKTVQPCLSFSSADFCDVRRLQQFLLSVTAKDVSLQITLRQIDDPVMEETNGLPSIEMHNKRYRVMISAIDLDPKPVNRIRRWLKQKDEMLKTYSRVKAKI